ncbi:hypothetical protein I79_000607 [Cricetulus griseus]|uniref:Uncharacterized protein n=1 Tax=Cricetulus griseus TaxID=10029 RepID=G3GSJ2_CRIGR|nr:hypothetical protein I79_000607 [Cricetulus griseus]
MNSLQNRLAAQDLDKIKPTRSLTIPTPMLMGFGGLLKRKERHTDRRVTCWVLLGEWEWGVRDAQRYIVYTYAIIKE